MNTPLEKLNSNAQRVRDCRQRKKDGSVVVQIVLTKSVVEIVDYYIGLDGATRTDVIQTWLTSWAIDAAELSPPLRKRIIKESNQFN